ncbi:glycerate kinase [Pleomorphochaeta sp. DL1XJH-081]|jgi:glycerate kinase|uniref:glycerate kinase family protein n=1 Tax=Pleomorphochaeta sp. DL1XJH-081 TaxID=3409690 RepID=UPI003BB6C830
MKKFLLIPDSFKGTMSSTQICSIMEQSILRYYPDAEVVSLPVADGGEGSVDSFLAAMGGQKVTLDVTGPYFQSVEGFFGVVNDDTAVVEMAACAGLPLVGDDKRPDQSTTFGVGELILAAAERGCKKIIVGLGGSATNDGGAGAAAAIGVKFFNKNGQEFIPTGGTLGDIVSIDASEKNRLLDDVEIITMCDIDNPLYGEQGAAYVFGPQKGADEKMVEFLDGNLRSLSNAIWENLGKNVSDLPGAGAAGGMGGGMVAFFDAKLEMGIEVVLDTVGFDELLDDADMVFTGEGKLDSQSLRGKVVMGIAKRTKQKNVPLVAIVGDIGDPIDGAYDRGVSAIFSINRVAKEFKQVMARAPQDLALTMDNLMRFLHLLKV